jgi:hypothetical protein
MRFNVFYQFASLSFFVKLSLFSLLSLPASAQNNSVVGNIDVVRVDENNYEILGWACQKNINSSISVHVYVGGPAGTGQFLKAVVADSNSEAAVANVCGIEGRNYRFRIPLTYEELQNHQSKAIYIHGIATAGAPNSLINNSGRFLVPSANSLRVTGNIDRVKVTDLFIDILGWACQKNIEASIGVRVYVGGPEGTGQLLKTAVANKNSEAAVANVCSNEGSNYRFEIPLSFEDIRDHEGKAIYIYGDSTNGAPDSLVGNSGTHSMPRLIDISHGIGNIEGVTFNGNNYEIRGWACHTYYESPVLVFAQFYSGNRKEVFITPDFVADDDSDDNIASLCLTEGRNYGFTIPLTSEDLTKYSSKIINIVIRPLDESGDSIPIWTPLENSGVYLVPNAVRNSN